MQAYDYDEPEGEFIVTEDLPNFRIPNEDEAFEYEEGEAEYQEGYEEDAYDEVAQARAYLQQQQQQQQYANSVPDVVKQFVTYFDRHIKDRNVYDIYIMYESSWNKITEKYFKNAPWPHVDAVAPLVNYDRTFLILYKELYYRHIYGRLTPTLDQHFESWKNYCDLFNWLLNAGADLALELPKQWLWDIVDEFIYQFQAFRMYTAKLKNKSAEELNILQSNPQVWDVTAVINFLQSMVHKSNIIQVLEKQKQGQTNADGQPTTTNVATTSADNGLGNHALYRQFGYFSLIGLLRVQVLLGDYHLALKTIAPIELFSKGMFTQVAACHISLHYFTGFAYMMMRRYVDAIKVFAHVLLFINRTKQYHTRSYQHDQMMKRSDKMYALLAICLSVCPQRVEENVHSFLREKHSDKMQRIQKGDGTAIEELFSFGAPKFMNPCAPNYAAFLAAAAEGNKVPFSNPNVEIQRVQFKLLSSDILQQVLIPTIRSYLKLYSTIEVQKLAGFLETDEKTFRTQLMCYKLKSRSLVYAGGAPLNGEYVNSSDVDFSVDKDMIHITDSKTQRRYSEFFIRHINKFDEIITDLEKRA